jgi:hypothetical protein
LTDDKLGSTPRFLPGSLAEKNKESEMEVEVVEDTSQAPGTPKSGQVKRKGAPDDTSSTASKLRPRH